MVSDVGSGSAGSGDGPGGGIAKGVAWGTPTELVPDRIVRGSDADLAAAHRSEPGARFGFDPDPGSDLAATLGLGRDAGRAGLEVRIDLLWVALDDHAEVPVCAGVTVGCRPGALRWWTRRRRAEIDLDGRTKSVRIAGFLAANAQHVAGQRLVPRGHPGDGRAEAQWFGLGPGERSKFRSRLPTADHLGHPDVGTATFRSVAVQWTKPVEVHLDSTPSAAATLVRIRVEPGALRLVI